MFWGDFRAKRHFQNDKKIASNKKTPSFQKKTKSFVSKNEVLAPLTLRFSGKRRRFPTVKTPSFFKQSSIYSQQSKTQEFIKRSNTRKNFTFLLPTDFSQAMKLKTLKIVNGQRLRKRRNDKECKERKESTRKHGLEIMGHVRFHVLLTIHAMKTELSSRYLRTETFPVVETTNLTSISLLPTLNMRSISLRKPHRKTKRAVRKKFSSEEKV